MKQYEELKDDIQEVLTNEDEISVRVELYKQEDEIDLVILIKDKSRKIIFDKTLKTVSPINESTIQQLDEEAEDLLSIIEDDLYSNEDDVDFKIGKEVLDLPS